jgi:pyruvate/2-oxoglutarate dehydrogenase complex dihydrolipoamide dehydrogenase (E3) component
MEANLRARTLSETRGFLKALVDANSDRFLGFKAFGVGAGEILAAARIAMIAGLPYTALRDTVLTHPNRATIDLSATFYVARYGGS